jgi:hypothetical protein
MTQSLEKRGVHPEGLTLKGNEKGVSSKNPPGFLDDSEHIGLHTLL